MSRQRMAALVAASGAVAVLAAPAGASAAPTAQEFAYTGAAQSWKVPAGVTSATFDLYGAEGSASAFTWQVGGRGAHVQATLAVTPGATMSVFVGGKGVVGFGSAFNGGGRIALCCAISSVAGPGGGASDVRAAPGELADRLLVAGGGGGAGGCDTTNVRAGGCARTGGAGGASASAGSTGAGTAPLTSGGGGGGGGGAAAQANGGAAGSGDLNDGIAGTAGSLGQGGTGGAGGVGPGGDGGGGGGGFYGGGGGGGAGTAVAADGALGASGGGGGGGSNLVTGTGTGVQNGVRAGNGLVTVTYEGPANSAPAAVEDSYATAEDTTLSEPAPGVLGNDSDPDGDALTAVLVSGPSHAASFTLGPDGSFSYRPAPGYSGPDSFSYRASDGTAESAAVTVSLDVTAVNHPPAADADAYSTAEDAMLAEPAPGVLGNDSDPDGDVLTAVLVSGPSHAASFSLGADGSFSYTPAADYNGPDSFSYRASDGTAESAAVTVSLDVTAVDDPPTVTVAPGGSCGSDHRSGTIDLTVADVDTPAAELTLSGASSNTMLVPNGGLRFGGDGAARTMTARASGATGTSTITVTVSDGSASGSVPVTFEAAGNGADTVTGTDGADILLGQNGDDRLDGKGGNDLLCGGRGDDRLTGGSGADHFGGGQGDDTATDLHPDEGDTQAP